MASWHGRPDHDRKLDRFVNFLSTKLELGCHARPANLLLSPRFPLSEWVIQKRKAGGRNQGRFQKTFMGSPSRRFFLEKDVVRGGL